MNARFMNRLEDFLVLLPASQPYQRYGPFTNESGPGLSASLFNGIERFLGQVDCELAYQPMGPFVNGEYCSVYAILNHIEEYLMILGETPIRQDLTPLQQIGAREPLGWMDQPGNFVRNPEYIEPRATLERVQYERMLVEYDYQH